MAAISRASSTTWTILGHWVLHRYGARHLLKTISRCTRITDMQQPTFTKIDPRFGTNEQFRDMVKQARNKGLGLIWDVVLNHFGAEYYFIRDLPSKDWINYPESRTRTNHLKTTITDPYASNIYKMNIPVSTLLEKRCR